MWLLYVLNDLSSTWKQLFPGGADCSSNLSNWKEEAWKKKPFLRQSEDQWPENRFEDVSPGVLELKKTIYSTGFQPPSPVEELINRSSDWVQTLCRVAWLLNYLDWLSLRGLNQLGGLSPTKKIQTMNQFVILSFGVDPLNWPSFIEIGEIACSTPAWCTHGLTLNQTHFPFI